MKKELINKIKVLSAIDSKTVLEDRYKRFRKFGDYIE